MYVTHYIFQIAPNRTALELFGAENRTSLRRENIAPHLLSVRFMDGYVDEQGWQPVERAEQRA